MSFEEKLKRGEELIKNDQYLEAFDLYCDLYYEFPTNVDLLKKALFLFTRINEGYSDFEPQTANEFLFRGVARFYKGELDNSNKDYDRAIILNPKLDIAHYNKSINYREVGNNAEAIRELEKAIAKNPNCVYYDELAENYFRIGKVTESLQNHEKAIQDAPENARIWFNYGAHLAKAGQFENAITNLKRALEIDPRYHDAARALAYVQSKFSDK